MHPPRLHREAQGQRPPSHVLEEARETGRRICPQTQLGSRLGAGAEGFWLVGDLTPGDPVGPLQDPGALLDHRAEPSVSDAEKGRLGAVLRGSAPRVHFGAC